MEKMNKIRNERHCTLFTVPDGGSITVDGTSAQIEYLDETHFNLVGPSRRKNCYHIDQFGDIFGRRNVHPATDDHQECFTYHLDSAHGGWVEVPKALLRELRLMNADSSTRISHYSFQKEDLAYLEDMRDASLFRSAMESRGRKVKYVQMRIDGESPIRLYEYFKCKDATPMKPCP